MSDPVSAPIACRASPARRRTCFVLYGLLLCVILLTLTRARSGPVVLKGWEEDLTRAIATAREADRPLLLFFHASWCGACHRFKRDVLVDDEVASRLHAAFVPTSIDATAAGGPGEALMIRYGVDAIPALIVLTPEGRSLGRFSGAMPRPDFTNWMVTCLARWDVERSIPRSEEEETL